MAIVANPCSFVTMTTNVKLRKGARTDRPLGTPAFVLNLERQSGRQLASAKRGRKQEGSDRRAIGQLGLVDPKSGAPQLGVDHPRLVRHSCKVDKRSDEHQNRYHKVDELDKHLALPLVRVGFAGGGGPSS